MYKVGIVGFGIVGKSILAFLNKQKIEHAAPAEQELFDEPTVLGNINVRVWDARALNVQEQEIVSLYKATATDESKIKLADFIKENDFIIASPGINLNDYAEYNYKFLCELDFFSAFFGKPSIGITGSLGKTTVTKLLGTLLSKVPLLSAEKRHQCCLQIPDLKDKTDIKAVIGGNVGVGMLDLIQRQDEHDIGVLELSSFQLDLSKKYAPDIAIWTNWYPNHLDRHETEQDYFDAKFNLLRSQRENQLAVLSADLFTGPAAPWMNQRISTLRSSLCVCSDHPVDAAFISSINKDFFKIFYIEESFLVKAVVKKGFMHVKEKIFDVSALPEVTFIKNWIQVLVALYSMGMDMQQLQAFLQEHQEHLLDDHHHRLEHFATIRGVDFYDDSKSTVIQSTLAAFNKLTEKNKPVVVFIGGLSKGADRSSLVPELRASPLLKRVVCFGKDCSAFGDCSAHATLEDALREVWQLVSPGDQVLFSPGGSSFDLFKDYKHRGVVFKGLVKKLGEG
jgi:UDP-N-acetylmuramoylalanine--D-glutamate ligase